MDRPGHPNNTLFFWGFEKENGSLTAGDGERSNEPWGIWLNGGYAILTPPNELYALLTRHKSQPRLFEFARLVI